MSNEEFPGYESAINSFAKSKEEKEIFKRLFEHTRTWVSRLTEYSKHEISEMNGTVRIIDDKNSVQSVFFYLKDFDDFERYPDYEEYNTLVIEYNVCDEKFYLAFGKTVDELTVKRDEVLGGHPAPKSWKKTNRY